MAAPPLVKNRVPAIVETLHTLLVEGQLISRLVPFDVNFAKDYKAVELRQQGVAPVEHIPLGYHVTVSEADDSIAALVEKLRAEGYTRYNSRIRFDTPELNALVQAMGPDPDNPDPNDASLREAQKRVLDMMGKNGPEAMAQALKANRQKWMPPK